MKIPFLPPYIDEAVINEVVDSLRSGWLTSGPKAKALEKEIKIFSNAKEVLCVNSWTSGAIMSFPCDYDRIMELVNEPKILPM